MKLCKGCGLPGEFYAVPANYCKECVSAKRKKHYEANREQILSAIRERRDSDEYRKNMRIYRRRKQLEQRGAY